MSTRLTLLPAPLLFALAGCWDAGNTETAADKLDQYLGDLSLQVRSGKPITPDQSAEARKLAGAVHAEVRNEKTGDLRARTERLAEVERAVDEARLLSAPGESGKADFAGADRALGRARDRLADAARGL